MAVSGVASANPWAIGASVLGSVASGVAESKARAEENKNRARQLQAEQQQFNQKLGEDQRQFNNNFGQTQYKQNIDAQSQYGDRAQSVNRELEVLPMRDKAAALLMQRMGNPAVQTTARSLAGGGTDALRGGGLPQMPYDLNKQAQQAAAYKAGDGGMTGDVQKELLSRYMNVPKSPDMQQPTGPNPAEVEMKVANMLRQWEQQGMKVGDRERASNMYRTQLMGGQDPYAKKAGV